MDRENEYKLFTDSQKGAEALEGIAPARLVPTSATTLAGAAGRRRRLPQFVDADEEWRKSPRPHPRPYFLYVGRLERLQGIDDLLRAFGSVPHRDLLIVGTGSDEIPLKIIASSDPRDAELSGAMNSIATEPERRRAMGERVWRTVEERRSTSVHLSQYLALLEPAARGRVVSDS